MNAGCLKVIIVMRFGTRSGGILVVGFMQKMAEVLSIITFRTLNPKLRVKEEHIPDCKLRRMNARIKWRNTYDTPLPAPPSRPDNSLEQHTIAVHSFPSSLQTFAQILHQWCLSKGSLGTQPYIEPPLIGRNQSTRR